MELAIAFPREIPEYLSAVAEPPDNLHLTYWPNNEIFNRHLGIQGRQYGIFIGAQKPVTLHNKNQSKTLHAMYENTNNNEKTAFIWLYSYLWGNTRHRWRSGPLLAQTLLRAEPSLFPTALWSTLNYAEPFLSFPDQHWLDDGNANESDIIKFAARSYASARERYSIIALRRSDTPPPDIAKDLFAAIERKHKLRAQNQEERDARRAINKTRLAERQTRHPKADEWPTLDKHKLAKLVTEAHCQHSPNSMALAMSPSPSVAEG